MPDELSTKFSTVLHTECVHNLRQIAPGGEELPRPAIFHLAALREPSFFSRKVQLQGTSDLFMNSHLAPKMPSFCVANLRNSTLLRAIRALNLNILTRPYFGNLPRPE